VNRSDCKELMFLAYFSRSLYLEVPFLIKKTLLRVKEFERRGGAVSVQTL